MVGWYDLFSRFYDRALEPLYEDARRAAIETLSPDRDDVILDLPCGTGQSFDLLSPRVHHIIGVDLSRGMLNRAQARISRLQLGNVSLLHRGVHDLSREDIVGLTGRGGEVDGLHVFLGLTAFPGWEQAFARMWELLRPGGRCVIVDVHAASPDFQGRMVNLVARADITRRVWEPLSAMARDFERVDLPSLPEHGGQLFLASGVKAA